ncbi:MAG: hypothetical protein RI988_1257 [Pseudomonadota bacterium]
MSGKRGPSLDLSLQLDARVCSLLEPHLSSPGLLEAVIAKREPAARGFGLNNCWLALTTEASAAKVTVGLVGSSHRACEADGHSAPCRSVLNAGRDGSRGFLNWARTSGGVGIYRPDASCPWMGAGQLRIPGLAAFRLRRHFYFSLAQTVWRSIGTRQFGKAAPAVRSLCDPKEQDLRTCPAGFEGAQSTTL